MLFFPLATAESNFSPFSLSHVRQISMGVHLRMMNESFFSIHGVPESINISKKPLCQNFHLFSSFKIFSNFMPYSRDVRSTLHGLLYTKPNLSLWGFTMPKGFGIGQHIREKPGTSKFTRTFGHPVMSNEVERNHIRNSGENSTPTWSNPNTSTSDL